MKTFVSQHSQRFKPLWAILTVTVVMSLALVAWGGSATTAVASTKSGLKRSPVVHTVRIIEVNCRFSFQPSKLMIQVGDIVVWKNVTTAPHTVTSNTGVFNTAGFLSMNQSFKFTFTRTGTFNYHCNIHPYMHATIIVKSGLSSNQGSSSSPTPTPTTPPSMTQPGG